MKHVVGVIVAMPQEAYALFGRLGWSRQGGFPAKAERFKDLLAMVVISGQGEDRSRKAAQFLLDSDPLFILNLGVAGALVKDMESGDLLVPAHVTDGTTRIGLSSQVHNYLKQLISVQGVGFKEGLLVSTKKVVSSPDAKAELHRTTGALAVDMEAHGVAVACSQSDTPLFVAKSIIDSISQPLPREITSCLTATGQVRFVHFLMTILSKPWLLARLIEMQHSFKAAVFSLEQVKSILSANISLKAIA